MIAKWCLNKTCIENMLASITLYLSKIGFLMNRKNKDRVYWNEFQLLATYPNIIHGCVENRGGYSAGPFSSLNTSFQIGDKDKLVRKNLFKIRQTFGLDQPIYLNQTHGTEIHIIKELPKKALVGDGMITNKKGIALCIRHADCQALFFYDQKTNAIGAVHVGWRGNVSRIIEKVIFSMQVVFGTKPQDLIACISPSLGPLHSEFVNAKDEFPEDFFAFEWKKNYYNLWEISKSQLLACGILGQHIEMANICTFENSNYFSYRKNNVTGRNLSFIQLK